jgi:hypothetical protein
MVATTDSPFVFLVQFDSEQCYVKTVYVNVSQIMHNWQKTLKYINAICQTQIVKILAHRNLQELQVKLYKRHWLVLVIST